MHSEFKSFAGNAVITSVNLFSQASLNCLAAFRRLKLNICTVRLPFFVHKDMGNYVLEMTLEVG